MFKVNGMGLDPSDKAALKQLYEKLSVDDLLIIDKYINIRANRRTQATLIDVERLVWKAFRTVRTHKGLDLQGR